MKSFLRGAAERLARRKTLWRRLPDRFGRKPICVSPDSALKLLKPLESSFGSSLLRLADEQVGPNDVVWDIGANVGVFAFAAATKCAKVLAVEPDPWLYSLLLRTCDHRENSGLQVQPVCAALADEPGLALLAIANRGRSANFIEGFNGSSQTGGIREKRTVPLLTLDILSKFSDPPAFIKIDVEGAELAVLRGARDLLEACRPRLLVEVRDNTEAQAASMLEALNYTLTDFATGAPWRAGAHAGSDILAVAN